MVRETFERMSALFTDRDSLIAILIAVAVCTVSLAVMILLRRVVRKQHAKMLTTEKVELLETPLGILSRTGTVFFVVMAIYFSLRTLSLSTTAHHILDSVVTIAIFWQAGIWATAAVTVWLSRKRIHGHVDNVAIVSSLGVIGFVAQALIWCVVLLLTLENLGVRVTALVAGLGVGGVAMALAVQNVLGDLLASLAITFDRPFVVGDFLVVGEILGSVEYIGVKTTRLRSLDGEQIIISNADLLKSRIHNYGRMQERRVLFNFSIDYDTAPDQLEALPAKVRAIIEAQSPIRFDRCHFSKYTDKGFEYEVVYYVLIADYNPYMDIQQTINIKLLRHLKEIGVQLARPTQTLYVVKEAPEQAVPLRSSG